ncbi:MAG TPA: sugar kinase, partial [Lentisphaeria bacterium]|nr:sugar kinase [Lentisphaeria bacterium]
VSCGGPLDSRRGVIQSPPNLPGWDEVPAVDILGGRLGIPVRLQNDANAGAVAEWKFGA